jgi:AcrR family transcriptional regulator
VSSFAPGSRPGGRADARRNAERILDATATLIATDPTATLEEVAARAGVSRATVYHHFESRDALLDTLTERSIVQVRAALDAARPHEDGATAAMERLLKAAWQVIGRYRGLVIVNPARLPRAELRSRLAPALEPVSSVVARGQHVGEFDPDPPVDWLVGILTDIIHAASRQVSAGAMTPDEAERLLLRTAHGTLTSHRARERAGVQPLPNPTRHR